MGKEYFASAKCRFIPAAHGSSETPGNNFCERIMVPGDSGERAPVFISVAQHAELVHEPRTTCLSSRIGGVIRSYPKSLDGIFARPTRFDVHRRSGLYHCMADHWNPRCIGAGSDRRFIYVG